jgi:hypothetical protein
MGHTYINVPGYRSLYSDSLRTGQSGDGNPVWVRFSAPIQTDLGAHPAHYTVGTDSITGVKRPPSGVNYNPI